MALLALLALLQHDGDFFERRIRPLLAEHCYACHSARAEKLKGGLLLDSADGLRRVATTALLPAVRWAEEDLRMPPKQKLPAAAIADLEAWVRAGAVIPVAKGAPGGGAHWAFLPPKDVDPPATRAKDWVRTPVDAFVLAKLEEKGLAPSPTADRATLLRRLSYDLTGLPPDVDDGAPIAEVVERLLASPRYGERWARHWLDVARYADTTDAGGDADDRMPHAGPYRDWVIRALNDDLPYGRFVKAQLAADLLSEPLEAMGFLTLGRRFNDNIHDMIDDRLDVLGRGLLGLTISCARCHDHKFDPIPTADYYSLYGVLAASKEKLVTLEGAPSAAHAAELRRRQDALKAYQRSTGAAAQARARAKVKDYWAALAGEAVDVDPLVLAQWKAYVAKAKTPFHPVFGLWHALVERFDVQRIRELAPQLDPAVVAAFEPPPASLKEAAARYGTLFEDAPAGPVRDVLYGPKALPLLKLDPGAVSPEFSGFEVGYEVAYLKSKIARWEAAGPGAAPRALILEDTVPKGDPHVFKRGSPTAPGEAVPRRFLAALAPERKPFANGSGRLELAEAVVASPLAARVLVNRVWAQHFGTGLVATPSDFGTRSEPPSHPELLDWLARRFVADGGSLKKLHRLLVLSAAYAQSSVDRPEARAVDPDNRLLWRRGPRRLDFEAMRDSLLAVAGGLDPAGGGASEVLTSQPYSRRRSVYGFVDRLQLSSVLMSFDFANPASHAPQRHFTTVPQQALFLMNSPFLMEQARRVAAREDVADPGQRIRALYRRIFGREPRTSELAAGLRFVREAPPSPAPMRSPWSYGFGDGRGAFTPLPHFTGEAWQAGPVLPDPWLGGLRLDATGGQPGEDDAHAAIRRWTAPRDGRVSVRGTVKLLFDADTYRGSIRVRIAGPGGVLAEKPVGSGEVAMDVEALDVRRGDTIDFVADWDGRAAYDRFGWAPVVRMGGEAWGAEAGFAGPAEAPLSAWEKYAQVLLETNEFLFLD